MRNRSDGERGKVGGRCDWGFKMIWKAALVRGGAIKPLGGLTRNLCGEEVWTL